MLKFFKVPFAVSGTKATIPDAVQGDGSVSYAEGYNFNYQRPKADPLSRNIERDKANGLYFDITSELGEVQAQGVPSFITTALNGGAPFPYGINAVVRYNGVIYTSRKTANTSLPTVAADWAVVRGSLPRVVAAGTADAITATFVPTILPIQDGELFLIRHTAANTSATPTIAANGGAAATVVKGNNQPLDPNDIAGAGFWGLYMYDTTLAKCVLLNPATGLVGGVPVGTSIAVNANVAPTGYLKENGAAYSRTVYAQLFAYLVKSAVATISIATPAVITWNNHGRAVNDPIKFTSTGLLPTGLTGGTTYYVISAGLTVNNFQLAATPGGAAIATSGTQSGIHTAICAPYGDGDGSTTFNVPDSRGEFWRGLDDGRGVDANRAPGSAQGDAMRNITGGITSSLSQPYYAITGSGAFRATNPGGTGVRAFVNEPGTLSISFDASRVTNTAAENRPRNVPKLFCIKF